MQDLPTDEWVVIFYPQTGATRLCPTLDFARNVVTSISTFNTNVYKSPNDFRVKHDHKFLEKCWRKLWERSWQGVPKSATGSLDGYSPEPPDVDTETFVKEFWKFLQDVGDRLRQVQVKTDRKAEHYELKLGPMNDLVSDPEAFKEKYNTQARTVFSALLNNGRQFLEEDDIKKIILRLVADRVLKTKQEPWTVFQYYRPQFIKEQVS